MPETNLERYNEQFAKAKAMLNENQLAAVEKIYGPVMTIAGPGTGKTQILAVRIGNILQKTDASTGNILCLTYTEAGSIAMRKRLRQFIGPEAYNVGIFTFHAFCNQVIKENIEYFGGYRDLQPVTDLELVDVYTDIIDGFSNDHPLKRLKGNIYYEKDRLKNLFSIMKQEGWVTEDFQLAIDALRQYHVENQTKGMIAGRKVTGSDGVVYQKGELREDKLAQEIEKYQQILSAAKELENYDKTLHDIKRYDYHDMILWVIDMFKQHPDLKAKYQERFQFILVDEYQDTNGAQNELLFLLADNEIDDQPNLFIVGDDDQSIYRFQGANMSNITDFKDRYNPYVVVLNNNYRSSQKILDKAQILIEGNQNRLINSVEDLTKELIESRTFGNEELLDPQIVEYPNIAQEEFDVIYQILSLRKKGEDLSNIAVIYRSHKHVDNMVKYLSHKGVPLNIKKKINVLKEVDVLRFITILKYLDAEYDQMYSGEFYLHEILHYDYFNISSRDIGMISIYCQSRYHQEDEADQKVERKKWRDVISDRDHLEKAGVRSIEEVLYVSTCIEEWITAVANMTPQSVFELIITKSHALDDILRSSDKSWKLQVINTFFDFIKDSSAREELTSIRDILAMIVKMEENNIDLPLFKITSNESGINFVTSHSSKGLEFKYVFIINATKKAWEEKSKNYSRQYSFPPTMIAASQELDIEDERRLFYVAMTRAEVFLHISYALENEDGKPQEYSRFIEDMLTRENEIIQKQVSEEEVVHYRAELMRYHQGKVELIDHDMIDRVLQTYKVSATSLNKFLRCPLAFYFENLLRVPMARSSSMGFGNAIHYALEKFFMDIEKDPSHEVPKVERLIDHFVWGMKSYHSHFTAAEFQNHKTHGETILTEYYDEYHSQWTAPRSIKVEYAINTEYKGVPISGKIDKLEIYDDKLSVIDYKTGRYNSKKIKGGTLGDDENIGGDYWRQMVFYKLLLNGDPYMHLPMKEGYMDFVEKEKKSGKFRKSKFEIDSFELELVGAQLTDTYEKIKNHEFENGCGEEDCNWCNFVNENMNVELEQMNEDNYDQE